MADIRPFSTIKNELEHINGEITRANYIDSTARRNAELDLLRPQMFALKAELKGWVLAILTKHGVTVKQVIRKLKCAPVTIEDYMNGNHEPPPYFELIVKATARDLEPLPESIMWSFDLAEMLDVPKMTERTWRQRGKFPDRVRLAAAAAHCLPPTASSWEINILDRVNKTPYRRITGGWASRPLYGKPLPMIKKDTATGMVVKGYLKYFNNELRLTDAGKRAIENRNKNADRDA